MPGLEYQGSVALSAAMPTVAASLAAMVSDVTARAAGQATLTVAPPTVVVDLIAQLTAQIGALTAMLGAGILVLPPTIAGSLSVLVELNALLTLMADLTAALGVGGIHLYTYDGTVGAHGPDFTTALFGGLPSGGGGPEQACTAVTLMANTAAGSAALDAVFG